MFGVMKNDGRSTLPLTRGHQKASQLYPQVRDAAKAAALAQRGVMIADKTGSDEAAQK